MRIELTASAWKAEVLPLYEPRMVLLYLLTGLATRSRTWIWVLGGPHSLH
jgi:hypothetical protein